MGHGKVTANGGDGGGSTGSAGGGGSGGRISVQTENHNKFNITLQAYGGKELEQQVVLWNVLYCIKLFTVGYVAWYVQPIWW